jgi:hypothetical protein
VLEAGKLGAVISPASPEVHRGAVTSALRFGGDAAPHVSPMARLDRQRPCWPIPFQENDVPSVTSLVGNVVRRRSEAQTD